MHRPKLDTATHCKLEEQERALWAKLHRIYRQRAGHLYGDHGWRWCDCGEKAIADTMICCYGCNGSVTP